MTYIKSLPAIFFFVIFFLLVPLPVMAATTAVKITDAIPYSYIWPGGQQFAERWATLNYPSGRIILSANPDGTGETYVDDAIDIYVITDGGDTVSHAIDYSENCQNPHVRGPQDVTDFFPPGNNEIAVAFKDKCGGLAGSSPLYLVNITDDPIPAKTPLIFIPGMAGSELKAVKDDRLIVENGHGGIYINDFKAGDKVWVNEEEAKQFGPDDYFDVLKLETDGLTGEIGLEPTGEAYYGSYGPTIEYFKNNGYTLNKDFFVFAYDWRRDIGLTASLLDQKIEEIKANTGSSKVDIVAHSMGGLVARNYIADSIKAQKVRKLVTLGTPYLGAVNALKKLMYGDCISKFPYSLSPICLGIAPSEVKDVLQNSSGAYQLVPSRTYYSFYDGSNDQHLLPFKDDRDIDKNGVTGGLNYVQTKTLLGNLKYNRSLYKFNETLHANDNQKFVTNGVDTTFIVGSGLATDGQIVEGSLIGVSFTNFLKLNGDNTVPLFSASLMDPTKNLFLNGLVKVLYIKNIKHAELPGSSVSLNLVNNILQNTNQVSAVISTTPFLLNGTQVSMYSSANIDIYDAKGNHTGLTTDGNFEENIPGSSYETLDNTKSIWLPDDGIYKVKFTSTNKGNLDYQIRTYRNDINTKTTLFKVESLTAVTKGEETLDTTAKQPGPLKLDKNGDGVIDLNLNSTESISGSEFNDHTPQKAIEPRY